MNSRQSICLSSSSIIAYLFLCLATFLNTAVISGSYSRNDTDHLALLSFKSMITDDPYGALSSWNSSIHFCGWSGVSCGKRHKRVTAIRLGSQGLVGSLSPHIGNLSFLRVFELSNNSFEGGSIPDTLGKLKSLTQLSLGDCNLHGTIPHSIYNLSHLTVISLYGNQLTGSLLPSIGEMLPHLVAIKLWDNQLNGLLPSSISNCSNLEYLEITGNNFNGKLKIDFSRLRNIGCMSLGDNNFGSGETDEIEFIIDSLKNCSKLRTLDMYNNKFQGGLPDSIGNFSKLLGHLNLGGNQLHGSLPSCIGNLVGLATLSLHSNHFIGKIPSTIGKLQSLGIVYLFQNQLSGPIPDSLGNLSLLDRLVLYSNRLEGPIPSILGNYNHLSALILYKNNLIGKIPKQILQLSSLSMALDLSENNLYGSLPSEVEHLKSLTILDLSYNNLSGNIPGSLCECTNLERLNLKGNLFQGVMPPSLSSMRGVKFLDVSHNNLSGQIPQFLEQFSSLYLNLSFNDFEGEVPVKGVFANASAFSILGNSRLCGGLPELGLQKCKRTKKHDKWTPLLVIVSISITCSLLAVLCFVFFWRKKKNKGHESQARVNEQFLKVSYNHLSKATNGFSEDNLIGKGGFSSVYKGILDHDGSFVAVKVLHLQNQGAHKSFIAECEAWRSIRHRNLLKIITACSTVDFQGNDFKALVYEFMPNGSLDDWLHSSASTSRLNLLQRINILTDVASALDYIHNHCQMAVVHRDLKPSNILLDGDMVAHVGDFGLARFLQTDSNQNTSTGIRGTIGYAAPEYGLEGEMTRRGDVYSFGILALEVMTKKRPTDGIFDEGLNLHKLACMALPDHVTDVVDGELVNFLQKDATSTPKTVANAKKVMECLASTVKIGVACSMDSPSDRMNIENVLYELQYIRDVFQNANVSEAL